MPSTATRSHPRAQARPAHQCTALVPALRDRGWHARPPVPAALPAPQIKSYIDAVTDNLALQTRVLSHSTAGEQAEPVRAARAHERPQCCTPRVGSRQAQRGGRQARGCHCGRCTSAAPVPSSFQSGNIANGPGGTRLRSAYTSGGHTDKGVRLARAPQELSRFVAAVDAR